MEGAAAPVSGAEAMALAMQAHFAKFPFARELMSNPVDSSRKALTAKAYVFRPQRICYLDNALGFGTRIALRVKSGEASGAPESS